MDKPTNRPMFECAICGELVPITQLSRQALRSSGADSRTEAVLSLNPEELTCQDCENFDEELATVDGEHLGRSPVERFEFSGTYVDPAKLQAYRLNY